MRHNSHWAWCPVCHKQLGVVGEVCPTCSSVFIPHDPVEMARGDLLLLAGVILVAVIAVAITAAVLAI